MFGVSNLKAKAEKWFGIYTAANVKGFFPNDQKVQDTANYIIKKAWNGEIEEARKWATNLRMYIQREYEADQKMEKTKMSELVRGFKNMWSSTDDEEEFKEKLKEQRYVENLERKVIENEGMGEIDNLK